MSTTTSISEQRGAQRHGLGRARPRLERDRGPAGCPPTRRRSAAPASAPGQTVLDVGCGSGVFLRAAADHGATVCGLDASAALLEIARERVPEADLCQGDLQQLPYVDDSFDAVCGFNSFFFADDMVAALREAGRVAKPGAPVVIQVWGRPEALRPPPHEGRPRPLHAAAAGRPRSTRPRCGSPARSRRSRRRRASSPSAPSTCSGPTSTRTRRRSPAAMMSAGGFGAIVGPERQDAARDAIVEALAVCRTPDGGYRLENEWHYLIARAALAGLPVPAAAGRADRDDVALGELAGRLRRQRLVVEQVLPARPGSPPFAPSGAWRRRSVSRLSVAGSSTRTARSTPSPPRCSPSPPEPSRSS